MFDAIDAVYNETLKTHRFWGDINEIQYREARDHPGQLFVSDWAAAENYLLLKANRIDTVVDCTADEDAPTHVDRLKGYHRVPVWDRPECDTYMQTLLTDPETDILGTIDAALQDGNVLVHCHAGVSRSCTVVACYLMQYQDMSLVDALRCIKANRAIAFSFGMNFHRTLAHFSKK